MFVSESRTDGLKELAYKYGAAAAVFLVNNLFLAYVFRDMMLVPGLSLIEQNFGSDAYDLRYGFLIFMNAVMSYLVPLVAFMLIFRSDMPEKGGIISFRSDDEYKRIPGETAILFICGIWAAMIGGYATNLISGLLNRLFAIPETKVAFSSIMPQNAAQFIIFGVGIVIIAPVCEELIYRHFLLKPLRKYGDTGAVVMTAVLFGIVHFNFDQLLHAFMFGLFLALIAVRSGSVLPCIVCHIINNVLVGIRNYLPETLGNESADAVFASARDAVGVIQTAILYGGALFMVAAVILKLTKPKCTVGIGHGKQLALIFTNPLVIIGLIAAFAVSFRNLYR